MTTFAYRAADRHGRTLDGIMEAPDARAVVEKLREDACFPIHIAPHTERARASLRFSLGHTSTTDDIDALVDALPAVIDRARLVRR